MATITLELEKKFKVNFTEDTLSESGVEEIKQTLRNYNLRDTETWGKYLPDDWDVFSIGKRLLPMLPAEWKWRRNYMPEDKRDPVRGFFVKRMETYYRNEFGFKGLPEKMKERIGTMVDQYVDLNSNHVIQITRDLDWKAGEFGDSGSCFWAGRSKARDYLKRIKAYAIQAFNVNNPNEGIGRCWMIADFPTSGTFTLFNGYGYNGDALRVFAKVFAKHIGGEQKKVTLKNDGSDSGVFYINGARGAIVALPEDIKKVKEDAVYDFHFKLKTIGRCSVSGDEIWEGDDYFMHQRQPVLSIYRDRFITCPHCNETHADNEANLVFTSRYKTDRSDGRVRLCNQCMRNRTVQDDITAARILDSDAVYVNGEGLTTGRDTLFDHCGICAITNYSFLKKNLITLSDNVSVSIGAYYHLKTELKMLLQDPNYFSAVKKRVNTIVGRCDEITTINDLFAFIKENTVKQDWSEALKSIFDTLHINSIAYMNEYEVNYV